MTSVPNHNDPPPPYSKEDNKITSANETVNNAGKDTSVDCSEDQNLGCEMCRNYELQLQIVQCNEEDLKTQLAQVQSTVKSLRDELKKEQSSKHELEEKFMEEAKATEERLKECTERLDTSNRRVTELRELFEELGRETSEQIAQFSSHKEDLCREVIRLSRENDNLLGRHIASMQSQIIDLPQDINEIHFFLLKMQEDFITTLVAKERLEESSRNEKTYLQNQLKTEVQSRDLLIQELTTERDEYRRELLQLRSEHEKQSRQLKDQEEILDQCQERIASLIVKNDATTTDLQWKVEDLTRTKGRLEEEVTTLRNKVQNLQVELDNSEAVQRDFVKLSQSLQIQLEKIRQADSEVRWQHEDDIHECNSCGRKLNSRKEKSHCSHCGRIFCHECNNKIILSGPKKRPFKVCSVCHTLLDHETAPFFSNTPPTGAP